MNGFTCDCVPAAQKGLLEVRTTPGGHRRFSIDAVRQATQQRKKVRIWRQVSYLAVRIESWVNLNTNGVTMERIPPNFMAFKMIRRYALWCRFY